MQQRLNRLVPMEPLSLMVRMGISRYSYISAYYIQDEKLQWLHRNHFYERTHSETNALESPIEPISLFTLRMKTRDGDFPNNERITNSSKELTSVIRKHNQRWSVVKNRMRKQRMSHLTGRHIRQRNSLGKIRETISNHMHLSVTILCPRWWSQNGNGNELE